MQAMYHMSAGPRVAREHGQSPDPAERNVKVYLLAGIYSNEDIPVFLTGATSLVRQR